MYKTGLSLALGVIAALVVLFAALFTGARFFTVFTRTIEAFVAGGLAAYLMIFFMERSQFVGFDRRVEPVPSEDGKDRDATDEPLPESSGMEKSGEESAGFESVNTEEFEHVTVPKG